MIGFVAVLCVQMHSSSRLLRMLRTGLRHKPSPPMCERNVVLFIQSLHSPHAQMDAAASLLTLRVASVANCVSAGTAPMSA